MNIAIFTPVSSSSAIGYVASLVSKTLIKMKHTVRIIRSEDDEQMTSEAWDFGAEIISWADVEQVQSVVKSADSLVYHIGNNIGFHKGCVYWLEKYPGIVCLHDFVLIDLFNGSNMYVEGKELESQEILNHWYGIEVAKNFKKINEDTDLRNTLLKTPLTEWICAMSTGVIAHSAWAIDRVLNSCPGPVSIVSLPYELEDNSNAHDELNDKFVITTTGYILPNKRISSVIKAIANSPKLRNNVVYRLVGDISDVLREQLIAEAQLLGVELDIRGRVSDAQLLSLMKDSQIISCLRWPVYESSSASAICAMKIGKPLVVTKIGFYDEIPDEYVIKIDPNNEIHELKMAFEKLYKDDNLRKKIGQAVRVWADKQFTTENYVTALLDIMMRTSVTNIPLSALKLFNGMMKDWNASPLLMCLDETLEPLKIFEKI